MGHLWVEQLMTSRPILWASREQMFNAVYMTTLQMLPCSTYQPPVLLFRWSKPSHFNLSSWTCSPEPWWSPLHFSEPIWTCFYIELKGNNSSSPVLQGAEDERWCGWMLGEQLMEGLLDGSPFYTVRKPAQECSLGFMQLFTSQDLLAVSSDLRVIIARWQWACFAAGSAIISKLEALLSL